MAIFEYKIRDLRREVGKKCFDKCRKAIFWQYHFCNVKGNWDYCSLTPEVTTYGHVSVIVSYLYIYNNIVTIGM